MYAIWSVRMFVRVSKLPKATFLQNDEAHLMAHAHAEYTNGDSSLRVACVNRWYDEMEEWIDEVLPAGSLDDAGFFAGDDASVKALMDLYVL